MAQRLFLEKQGKSVDESRIPVLEKMAAEHTQGGLFVSYLLACAREGHLHVSIEGDKIYPSCEAMGWVDVTEQLLYEANRQNTSRYISRQENRFYLERYWTAENRVRMAIAQMEQEPPPSLPISELDPSLSTLQRQAIRDCLARRFSILSGGPGTGKTYTAAHLVCTVLKHSDLRIALAAPTGKAAGNLQSALRTLLPDAVPEVETVHRLLRLGSFGFSNFIHPADLILIDEASMLDVELMAKLFGAIKPGARLILMGDPDQLPPVEAGGLFADLVSSGRGVSALSGSVRVETNALLELADLVRAGDPREALASYLVEDPLALAIEHYSKDLSGSFRILTPFRQGLWGVVAVNQAIQAACSSSALPIMITQNDHSLRLYNGDIGTWYIDQKQVHFDGGRIFPVAALPPHELAYAISVHKSQGSEFDRVLLLLPEGSERFGRPLLYTALTRAKRHFHLAAAPGVLDALL